MQDEDTRVAHTDAIVMRCPYPAGACGGPCANTLTVWVDAEGRVVDRFGCYAHEREVDLGPVLVALGDWEGLT